MKKEILCSISATLNTLGVISVHGRDNVRGMNNVFEILEGLAKYVSQLPDDEEIASE